MCLDSKKKIDDGKEEDGGGILEQEEKKSKLSFIMSYQYLPQFGLRRKKKIWCEGWKEI